MLVLASILLVLLLAAPADCDPLQSVYPEKRLVAALQPGLFGSANTMFRQDTFFYSRAVFSGEVRPLRPETREDIRAWLAARPQLEPSSLWTYVREFRFIDGDREIWLPVREGGDIVRQLTPGEQIGLFVHYGGRISGRAVAVVYKIARGWDRPPLRWVHHEASLALVIDARDAEEGVKRIRQCLTQFRQRRSREGLPASLADLGPQGTGCLDAALASGLFAHHRFTFVPGLRDPGGRTTIYSLCARPERPVLDGTTTFVADDEEARSTTGLGDGRSLDCAQAWAHQPMRLVKHCLLEQAGRDPAAGYARDLRAFGPGGNGCLAGRNDQIVDGLRYHDRSADIEVEYRPGGATFELRSVEKLQIEYVEYLMTEAGSHAALRRKGATRHDPPPEVFTEQLLQEFKADHERQKRLAEGCQRGRGEDCYELGHRQYVWRETAKAGESWTRGCQGGVSESCLFVSSVPHRVFIHALTLKRRCEAGEGDACRDLAEAGRRLGNGEEVITSPPPPKLRLRP